MNSAGGSQADPERLGRVTGRLEELVRMESPSGDRVALRRLAEMIAAPLADRGADVVWHPHPTGDAAVLRFAASPDRSGEAPLVLPLHLDTVWPAGRLETMPWSVTGDIVRGPGAFDMKAGIVIVEEALAGVLAVSHRPIVVVLVADEEVGTPTARGLLEAQAAGARAVLGFEPPHPDGALKTGRWGSTRLRIAVEGREAHAALDAAKGVSAIDELVDQLLVVRRLTSGREGVLANIGTIAGGTRANVIAGAASAELGLRFRDEVVESELLGALTRLTPVRDGAVVGSTVLSNRPAWQPGPAHDDLVAEITAIAGGLGQAVTGRPTTGAADTNFTGRLGVPTVDGLGPVGSGAHAATEQLSLRSLLDRIDLVTALLGGL